MERTTALRSLVGATIVAFALMFFAGAAQAGDYTSPPPKVSSNNIKQDPAVAAKAVTRDSALPVTGSDVAGISIIGGGLVLAGGAVLIARRRTAA